MPGESQGSSASGLHDEQGSECVNTVLWKDRLSHQLHFLSTLRVSDTVLGAEGSKMNMIPVFKKFLI